MKGEDRLTGKTIKRVAVDYIDGDILIICEDGDLFLLTVEEGFNNDHLVMIKKVEKNDLPLGQLYRFELITKEEYTKRYDTNVREMLARREEEERKQLAALQKKYGDVRT